MDYLAMIKDIFLYSDEKPLLFTQLFFWVFFAIVIAVYALIYKQKSLRNIYLFIVSLFFYYKTGGYFFSLLIFSTLVDYSIGLSISMTASEVKKKLLVALSVIINLGVLAYFKYSYFFIEMANHLIDFMREANIAEFQHLKVVNVLAKWTNELAGSGFDVSVIILPVGISFYTFQTISYTVDVYRKKVAPVTNILDFGFYVSFFPQLVAGPIVRAAEFIPQLYQDYRLTKREMGHATFLILNGLIKKVIISDYISINFVDRVFDSPLSYSGFENLLASYGYSVQIYCDFSGYTDMAIGIALLLGIRLPINFYSPYKSDSITDFWRRWHISLSSWLRDYLYIPLGGSRKGTFRTYLNLIVTMLLGGLWHGANLRFIIWGALHGAALTVHKIWTRISPFKKSKSGFSRFLAVSGTFHFVTFAWIFFRAQDMSTAMDMIKHIATDNNYTYLVDMIIGYKEIIMLITAALVIHWLPSRWKEFYRGWYIKTPIYVKVLIVVVVIFVAYQVKSSELQPFIYFRF